MGKETEVKSVSRIEYLRISLLTACNLNCRYCRPRDSGVPLTHIEADPAKLMSAIAFFAQLGVSKIRFTGGEPTLYRRLPDMVSFVKRQSRPIHTCLTTNGLLLSRQASVLARAGLNSVNISLDTIRRTRFRAITGTDALDVVLAGIKVARGYFESVKLNCVVINGVNDDEIEDLILFADNCGVDIRFIEYMPTSSRTRDNSGYLPTEKIIGRLPYRLSPVEPAGSSAARYFRSPELGIRVGFISPVSHPFCDGCNRIRLTSDGRLYSCLFSAKSLNLFDLLQSGDESAQEQIQLMMSEKRFSGCSNATAPGYARPTFVVMGG